VIDQRLATERRAMAQIFGEELARTLDELRDVVERQLGVLRAELLADQERQQKAAGMRERELEVRVRLAEVLAEQAKLVFLDSCLDKPKPAPRALPEPDEEGDPFIGLALGRAQ
jgi:hypothetical protein